jgi:tetratricopeptide (TPR) repeat protein
MLNAKPNQEIAIMYKKTTLFLTACLITGLIASCSSSSPLLKKAKSNIKSSNYDSVLAISNRYIQQYPDKPLGYYYKGVALGQEADSQDISTPQKAQPFYKEMAQNFSKAEQIADTMDNPPGEIKRIGVIKSTFWRDEHNLGVKYAQKDSLHNTVDDPLEVSIGHLQNATIIQPDSALSWSVLAQVSGMKGHYKQAAQAEQKYVHIADSLETRDYLLLGQYYERAKQPQKAISVLSDAQNKYPDSTRVVEMLADAYSNAGQSDKSIHLVKQLVQKEPNNPRYRLSLGTQIYKSVLGIQDKYNKNMNQLMDLQMKKRKASGSKADQIEQQMDKLESETKSIRDNMKSLTDQAIKQLKKAAQNKKGDPKPYNTLGIIYQNKASMIFKERNLTLNNEKAKQLNDKAKQKLAKAAKNYKKAAQLDPSNKKYWRSLYQIYTALGKDQKAQQAKQKAGMQ